MVLLSSDKKAILTTTDSFAAPASTILPQQLTHSVSDTYVGLDIHTFDIPSKYIQLIVKGSWQNKLIPEQMLCNFSNGRQKDKEKESGEESEDKEGRLKSQNKSYAVCG